MITDAARELNDALEAATGTRLPYLDMRVAFDDGTELESHADQRDMRRAQIAIGVEPDQDPLGFNRACAWAYLTRVKTLEMGWAEFDASVPFVIPVDKEPSGADPTGTATAD